jgi:multidrug efflux pump
MSLSGPFIARPVATTLLTMGIALAGIMAFRLLPVAPLPPIEFPAISVNASMPGASPEVMASSVATPLERHLGTIADVTEMTSTSSQNTTNIQLIFGLDRDIDGAARDVQAAIVAARQDLPTSLRSNPTYRKFNAASAPVIILSLTSGTLSQGQIYDAAATVMQQKLSQIEGVGNVGSQRQRAQGRHRERPAAFPDLHERPGQPGLAIQAASRRLSRRLAGTAAGYRDRYRQGGWRCRECPQLRHL